MKNIEVVVDDHDHFSLSQENCSGWIFKSWSWRSIVSVVTIRCSRRSSNVLPFRANGLLRRVSIADASGSHSSWRQSVRSLYRTRPQGRDLAAASEFHKAFSDGRGPVKQNRPVGVRPVETWDRPGGDPHDAATAHVPGRIGGALGDWERPGVHNHGELCGRTCSCDVNEGIIS